MGWVTLESNDGESYHVFLKDSGNSTVRARATEHLKATVAANRAAKGQTEQQRKSLASHARELRKGMKPALERYRTLPEPEKEKVRANTQRMLSALKDKAEAPRAALSEARYMQDKNRLSYKASLILSKKMR